MQLHEAELMRLVCLVLLNISELTFELFQQALKHLHDVAGLELVRGHLRCAVAPQGATASLLLHESGQHASHARHLGGHALEQSLCLSPVVVLRGQNLNRTCKRVYGLSVVLGKLQILRMLACAGLRRRLLLASEFVDLRVERTDLAAELGRVAVRLVNESDEFVDFGLAILDVESQFLRAIVDPLRIGAVSLFLHVHLLLPLGMELRQHVDDLLRGGHLCQCLCSQAAWHEASCSHKGDRAQGSGGRGLHYGAEQARGHEGTEKSPGPGGGSLA
mmetsp:Transcript_74185/g.192729  ORF Transcript_74185/g.192729 Transcript_74185/m.192729 type:complete len:275 (-) Transcript_74185:2-826(-)